ncbi:MAG: hypothetical protein RIF41_02095 [Polyangiaceae bacterium]
MLAAVLATSAEVQAADPPANDDLPDDDYGAWRYPGRFSWEAAVGVGPGWGFGEGFAGSRLTVTAGFRYLVDPPPPPSGDIIDKLVAGLGETLKIASIGNQYGADLRFDWMKGYGGRSYLGADLRFVALAVLPLAPDLDPPPRFNSIVNALPGIGFMVGDDGEPALLIPIDIPVAVLLGRHAGIELGFRTAIVVGAEDLPTASGYVMLSSFVR